MKKTLMVSLYMVLFLMVAASCKKYDDGPLISLRSKSSRLENTWRIEEKYVQKEARPLTPEDQNFRLAFLDVGFAVKTVDRNFDISSYNGTWNFDSHKKNVKTIFTYSYFGKDTTEITDYSVLRLKEKSLWLEEKTSGGEVFEYHLIPE